MGSRSRYLDEAEFEALKSGHLRDRLIERDGMKCHYCGCRLHDNPEGHRAQRRTMDHVVPRHLGGPLTFDNLVNACARCNSKKGSKLDPIHCAFCERAFALYPPHALPPRWSNAMY